MAGYTEADLELARAVLGDLQHVGDPAEQLAWHFADVRNETIERCAVELDDKALHNRVRWDGGVGTLKFAALRLRALKDGAK